MSEFAIAAALFVRGSGVTTAGAPLPVPLVLIAGAPFGLPFAAGAGAGDLTSAAGLVGSELTLALDGRPLPLQPLLPEPLPVVAAAAPAPFALVVAVLGPLTEPEVDRDARMFVSEFDTELFGAALPFVAAVAVTVGLAPTAGFAATAGFAVADAASCFVVGAAAAPSIGASDSAHSTYSVSFHSSCV